VLTASLAGHWKAALSDVTLSTLKITQVIDRSGSGRTATQATDSLRPQWEADHGDGAPAIAQLLSAGERLGYTPVPNLPAGDFTTIMLFKAQADTNYVVWGQANNSVSNPFVAIFRLTGGANRLSARGDSGTQAEIATANTVAHANWAIVTVRRSANVFGVRLNEGTEVTATVAIGATTIDNGTIGCALIGGALTFPLVGWWRELRVYQTYKSNEDQVFIRDSIRAEWPSI
jgi:hypothetical protein